MGLRHCDTDCFSVSSWFVKHMDKILYQYKACYRHDLPTFNIFENIRFSDEIKHASFIKYMVIIDRSI